MEFHKNKPIYQQIADHFYEKILKHQWKPEERIPSVREVSVTMEVNPNTAIRAYELLQNLGVIYNQRGRGYYVAPDGYQKVLAVKRTAFKKEVLPDLFKQMELLKIDIKEVEALFLKHQNNPKNENEQ